jgi:hypothetical protein
LKACTHQRHVHLLEGELKVLVCMLYVIEGSGLIEIIHSSREILRGMKKYGAYTSFKMRARQVYFGAATLLSIMRLKDYRQIYVLSHASTAFACRLADSFHHH